MLKKVAIVLVLITFFALTNAFCATQLSEITQEISGNAKAMLVYKAEDFYNILEDNLSSLKKISEWLPEMNRLPEKDRDRFFRDILMELERITTGFVKLDEMNGEIRAFMKAKVEGIKEQIAGLSPLVSEINREIKKLQNELDTIKYQNPPDASILIPSKTKQLEFKEAEKEMVEQFSVKVKNVEINAEKFSKNIDTILVAIHESRDVYTAALNVFNTAWDLKMLANAINDITSLSDLAGDLVNSWDELSMMIDDLSVFMNDLEVSI